MSNPTSQQLESSLSLPLVSYLSGEKQNKTPNHQFHHVRLSGAAYMVTFFFFFFPFSADLVSQ